MPYNQEYMSESDVILAVKNAYKEIGFVVLWERAGPTKRERGADLVMENALGKVRHFICQAKGTPERGKTDNRVNYFHMVQGEVSKYAVKEHEGINCEYAIALPHTYRNVILNNISREGFLRLKTKIILVNSDKSLSELVVDDFNSITINDIINAENKKRVRVKVPKILKKNDSDLISFVRRLK